MRALFERDPDRVERLFFEERLKSELGAFCQALTRSHQPYRQVGRRGTCARCRYCPARWCRGDYPPRPLIDFDPHAAREWAQDGKPQLILDGVGNPHNLDAIGRSSGRWVRASDPVPGPAPAALRELRQVYRLVKGAAPGGWGGARPVALVVGNEETGLGAATFALGEEVGESPAASACNRSMWLRPLSDLRAPQEGKVQVTHA